MGRFSDRLGRRVVLFALAAASAACSLVFGWLVAAPIAVVFAVGAVYGFTALGDSPVLSTALTETVGPAHLGAALALRSFLGFGAGAVAPIVFGRILDLSNAPGPFPTTWGWAFVVLGLGGLAAAYCAWGLVPDGGKPPRRHDRDVISYGRRTRVPRPIPAKLIEDTARELMARAAIDIPADYRDGVRKARERERNRIARFVLTEMERNWDIATAERRPMCADTGLPRYYVRAGNEAVIEGGFVALERALRRATADATASIPLRPNRLHPVTRRDHHNYVGIGAMGFAGTSLVVATHIEVAYTHTGGLPVGMHSFCLSSRRATARIHTDGRVEFRADPMWFTDYYRREGVE